RTCEECRRLADKGAYEQSVRAYKEFIETHEGHFQIDDAYFAIAEILDEKLFRFQEALPWYHRLIIEYPDGTLTPLAKQRIRYLSEYSEYDYRPLARFEQIRKVEFARRKDISQQRDKLLEEVASVISEYPDANLAPVMQYWLANQYRQTGPQKAVDAYYVLREKYPDHPDAREVLMDIGQTCYEAGRYEEAMEVYGKALLELPSLEGVIKVQISRCKRNIRRDWFALVCWPLLVLISAVAILATPVGIGMSKIASSLAVFALLAAFLSFGAWLIYEQFSSVREMLLIVISFAAAAGVSSLISVSLAEKLFGKRLNSIQAGPGVLSVVAGSIVGLILFTAGLYLAIYYINAHYLIVVGM
ncbi:MAG: tetratricopeptide repeat protein, partial [Planctomycetota bacterium]